MTTPNPWQALEHARTDEFADSPAEAAAEHAIIDAVYRSTDVDSKPCHADDCDGTMHWRETVGALQCSTCRALASSNGEPITKKPAR